MTDVTCNFIAIFYKDTLANIYILFITKETKQQKNDFICRFDITSSQRCAAVLVTLELINSERLITEIRVSILCQVWLEFSTPCKTLDLNVDRRIVIGNLKLTPVYIAHVIDHSISAIPV